MYGNSFKMKLIDVFLMRLCHIFPVFRIGNGMGFLLI